MRPRSTSGQAAVEYIAVVTLVAIVFAVGGAFVLNGRAIAAATVAQLRRGLCIVEGHDCPERHSPCSLSSRSSALDWHVDIAIVRLGGGRSAVVEHLSDGRILVTLASHFDAGATGGFGADLEIGDKIAVGGEVRAAVLAGLGTGMTYRVPDDRTADQLIRTLQRGNRMDPAFWRQLQALMPRVSPVARYRELHVSGSASFGPLAGKLDVAGGGREDLVTHRRTYYLKGSVSLDGTYGVVSGGGSADGKVAITFDRHGKPVELTLVGAGKLHGSANLPVMLQPVAGHLAAGAGRDWGVEGHLDLTQPGRAKAVLSSLRDPSRLVKMMLDEGVVEANTYGTRADSVDVGAHVKVGLAVGGDISRTTSSRRLITAMEHTPEGFWVPRYDCLTAT